MTTDTANARLLLQVAPADYVSERARLVKQGRSDGDRALAGFYQSLKRPNLSLWAVLAAGDDANAVHGIVAATTELAKIQAGGSAAGALSKATQSRRKALEALVDSAVTALARWESVAEPRRAEIRSIVDQLSRHVDVADAWIDGTLRDLPDDAWGFGAFSDLEVTAGGRTEPPRTVHPKAGAGKASTAPTEAAAKGPSRAERAEKIRQARHDVAAAQRDVSAAERRVEAARQAERQAQMEKRLADKELATAERRHTEATAQLESAQSK